jgi:nicotinamide riboside kinase
VRIAVLGPESSGKTTLVTHLAAWLHQHRAAVAVEVVADQGRLLAEQLPPGHPWSFREQLATSLMYRAADAVGQLRLRVQSRPGVLLSDGSTTTPLVWHTRAVRHRAHYDAGPPEASEELLAAAQSVTFDLVLLTAPDTPFVTDGIRDDPQGRHDSFEQHLLLHPQATVISGQGREQQARAEISALLGIDDAT